MQGANRRCRLALVATIFVAATLLSAPALGQGWTPDSHRSQVGGELAWWSSDETLFSGGTVMPIIPFGSLRLADAAQLDFVLPTALWLEGPGLPRQTTAAIGNPTIGGRYAPIHGIVAWSIGGRLSLPVATIDDGDLQRTSYAAGVAYAYYDLHRWAPNYLPFGLTTSVEIHVADPVSIFIEVDPTFYGPMRRSVDFEFTLQTRFGLEARHPVGFGGGFAVPVFLAPTAENFDLPTGDDAAQISLDAFLGYTHRVFFARVGNILAIDDPLGFGFDDGRVYTVYFKAGAFFDGHRRRR